ncbi:MAG: hypothetical protein QXZ12_07725, partial [Thermoplasmata archaeon]
DDAGYSGSEPLRNNTFNIYVVHPESNGIVTSGNIIPIGQFGYYSILKSSNITSYTYNFNVSYFSINNTIYSVLNYQGIVFNMSVDLSEYNFTGPSSGIYYFGNGNSGNTGSNNGYVFCSIGSLQNKTATYKTTFIETGLPTGTEWYVNLTNGQFFSSTGNQITMQMPNGTYSYTIATSDTTFEPSTSSGSFTVDGTTVSVSV